MNPQPIIEDIRNFLNIEPTDSVFDGEIYSHVMAALGRLSQNGVVNLTGVTIDTTTTWDNVIVSELNLDGEVLSMVPLYVKLSTKILFDPPPPSSVPFYQSNLDDMLWRLRLIHDTKGVTTIG